MSKKILLTDYFNLHNANQFRESISETANSIYYVFAGGHIPYANSDEYIPDIYNYNDEVNINPYKYMVFGKKVSNNDVKIMVPRYDWVANTVYTAYRGNTDLSDKNYYAVVNAISNFYVFKVLDNNGNSASTIMPNYYDTSEDDEYYSTSDGYVWKYMYSIDKSSFEKFATDDYIPVIPNANVQGNAVSGAIEVIIINYNGSNYNSYLSNTFISTDLRISGNSLLYNIANNANIANDFFNGSYIYIKEGTGSGQIRKIVDYVVIGNNKRIEIDSAFTTNPDITSIYEITPSVNIVGDGSNAIARAIVNTSSSNSITKIEIIERGYGYTFATASVTGNTGGISNSANLSVVIGPKGGHGKNPEYELGGKYLCISVNFANNQTNTIPVTNDYRTLGIIKDPFFSNVVLTVASTTGIFSDEEKITQSVSNATGIVQESTPSTVTVSNVTGIFVTNQLITGFTSGAVANVTNYTINGQTKDFNTFDNRHKYTYSTGSGNFVEDEKVYQLEPAFGNAYFHSNDNN